MGAGGLKKHATITGNAASIQQVQQTWQYMIQEQWSHFVDYCVIAAHFNWPAKWELVEGFCRKYCFEEGPFQGRHGGLVKLNRTIIRLFLFFFSGWDTYLIMWYAIGRPLAAEAASTEPCKKSAYQAILDLKQV